MLAYIYCNTGSPQVFFAVDGETQSHPMAAVSPPSAESSAGPRIGEEDETKTSSLATSPLLVGTDHLDNDGSVIPYDRPGGQSAVMHGVMNPAFDEVEDGFPDV